MNLLNFGGKQPLMRDSILTEDELGVMPTEHPWAGTAKSDKFGLTSDNSLKVGDTQHMVFQEGDAPPFNKPKTKPKDYIGKAKGIAQILWERGHWTSTISVPKFDKMSGGASFIIYLIDLYTS